MFDPVDLLLPQPIKLVLLLLVLCGYAIFSRRTQVAKPLRTLLLLLVIWAWIFSTPAFPNWIMATIEGKFSALDIRHINSKTNPLIVVLPSGQMFARNGRPIPRLDEHGWERLRAGIQLWKKIGGTLLLVGGPGKTVEDSFAGFMLKVAEESGIPRESISLTFQSRSTYEDILQASPQIKGYQGPVWLVTSAVHMPRAMAVGRKLGLAMDAFPCDYRQVQDPTWRIWFPDNGGPSTWAMVLHELIGYQYYRLKNWVD